MKKRIKRIIQLTIGIIILFLLFRKVGLTQFFEVFKTINLFWFFASFLLSIPMQLFGALNISLILKAMKQDVPYLYLLKANTLSQSIGAVAPGRLGDFSLIYFLKNQGVEYGKGLVASILDKLITFFVLVILALTGIYLFLDKKLFILILGFSLLAIILLIYAIWSNKIRSLIRRYLLKSYSQYFHGFSRNFKYVIKRKKLYLFLNVLVTLLRFFSLFFAYLFIFKAFNQPINFIHIIFISSITTIVALIPISFSGLGLREGSGAYLYNIISQVDLVISTNVMVLATIRRYTIAFIFYLVNLDLLDRDKKSKS